jgi:hypothetical protein
MVRLAAVCVGGNKIFLAARAIDLRIVPGERARRIERNRMFLAMFLKFLPASSTSAEVFPDTNNGISVIQYCDNVPCLPSLIPADLTSQFQILWYAEVG